MSKRIEANEPIEPATEPKPATEAKPAAAQRQSSAPICPIHKVRCKAGHSTSHFTRYYCPEKDCDFSVKQQRPTAVIPREEEDFSAR